MRIQRLRAGLVSFSTILLTLLAVGCGSGSSAPHGTPETSIAATENPLVAQYTVNLFGPATVWAEFGTDTSYGKQTWSVTSTGSTLQTNSATILIAGMTPATTYHMRAHVEWTDGSSWVGPDETFTTGVLPSNNALTLTAGRPSSAFSATNLQQDGVELLSMLAPGTSNLEAAVSDLDGNIIWYYDVGGSQGYIPFPIKLLSNGHMLVNISNFLGRGTATALREIDLAGNTVRELSWTDLDQELATFGFPFDVTLHHDLLPLPNGHLILLANTVESFTDLPGYAGTTAVLGDVLIDLDPNWNPVWVWNSFDHLDVNRHLMGLPDWTHGNAVVYTPNDGNLLLSMRNQSWIVKIDYANGQGTGNILWRLGEGGDFSLTGGDPSQWFYAQHFPSPISINGSQMTLAVVDNGNLRILDNSGTECGLPNTPACYTRATIFQVDEAAKIATLQWQYLPGIFSFYGGSILQLDNGNIEFDMSAYSFTGSEVVEVTQTSSPQVVWQMDVQNAQTYRAYRIPSLYPGVTWTK